MKKMRTLLFLLLYMAALSASLPAFGQNEPLSEKEWHELTDGLNYDEEEPEERTNTGWRLPHFKIKINIIKYGFFSIVLTILIYFLVRYILTLQGNAAKEEEDMHVEVNTLHEAEENLMLANLPNLIAKLLAEQKYREATRAYFLLVLQRLAKKKIIEWKKPKTNFDYAAELANQPYHSRFSELTYYFELIWYGQKQVSQEEFTQLEPQFKDILNQVAGNE